MKREGWWEYKLCFGGTLRQYHEEKGKIAEDEGEFILGKFSSKELVESEDHVSETYENGDTCTLTGRPRSTEIRYHCSQGDSTVLTRIQEPSTCSYIAHVFTPLLCKHPKYKPKKEKEETIYCFPVEKSVIEDYYELDEGENTMEETETASFTKPSEAPYQETQETPPASPQEQTKPPRVVDKMVDQFISQQFKYASPPNSQQYTSQQVTPEQKENDAVPAEEEDQQVIILKFETVENLMKGKITQEDLDAIKQLFQATEVRIINQDELSETENQSDEGEEEEEEEQPKQVHL